MRGEFRVDFFLLCSIQREIGKALADKFLPIRHGTPSSAGAKRGTAPPILGEWGKAFSSRRRSVDNTGGGARCRRFPSCRESSVADPSGRASDRGPRGGSAERLWVAVRCVAP